MFEESENAHGGLLNPPPDRMPGDLSIPRERLEKAGAFGESGSVWRKRKCSRRIAKSAGPDTGGFINPPGAFGESWSVWRKLERLEKVGAFGESWSVWRKCFRTAEIFFVFRDLFS